MKMRFAIAMWIALAVLVGASFVAGDAHVGLNAAGDVVIESEDGGGSSPRSCTHRVIMPSSPWSSSYPEHSPVSSYT